ncbi:MAG: ABC transporter permease [Verrucomicrobiaceae bacterium]|nr:ABC transporter permease [Verrucomicrobiaceae bacterium]
MAEEAYSPSKIRSDVPFLAAIWGISGMYVVLIIAVLAADASYTSVHDLWSAVNDPNVRASIWLTLQTCSVTAILSVIVSVPAGYVLARYHFPLKRVFDSILDIPIVLPPLVIGLSLLILFNQVMVGGQSIEKWLGEWLSGLHAWNESIPSGVTYRIPAIILAQFTVSCAFAVRTMRNTFDGIDPRQEKVAMTLGCGRSGAFWLIALPQASRGVIAAGTLAWARALGEFGPVLVFAGATRGSTEVLATTVFLEISIGNLEGAVAVSFLMIAVAIMVLTAVRILGMRQTV